MGMDRLDRWVTIASLCIVKKDFSVHTAVLCFNRHKKYGKNVIQIYKEEMSSPLVLLYLSATAYESDVCLHGMLT